MRARETQRERHTDGQTGGEIQLDRERGGGEEEKERGREGGGGWRE